mmetsp:Transcript_45763/g.83833  ORF Transcript_45763/g.83833 Transcript_45763/m.83833 type:complete len:263 (-) Transcript_45763:733-1521(-)
MPKSSLAAESAVISSVNASFSSFRVSVASATSLSRASMPSVRALISSFKVEMPSSASSMANFTVEMVCSKPFSLSSVTSNCFSQYSFLWSSSVCSFAKTSTSSSISLKTFSKLTFLPVSATAMRSNAARLECVAGAFWISARAFLRTSRLLDSIWTKLGLGNVFLKSSKASSSFKILIVSAMATFSSALIFSISSHSLSFEAQFSSMSAKNFLSSAKASSVSPISLAMLAMSTPNLPTRADLSSIAAVCAAISFSFAATNSA